MPAASLSRLLDSIKRAMWRAANLPGETLTWRRDPEGVIRLEIAVDADRVVDDVPRFDGARPRTMGPTT